VGLADARALTAPTHDMDMETASNKSGWLSLEKRRMGRATWHDYWFVLEDNPITGSQLRFYDDRTSRKPIGGILVCGSDVASCTHARANHFAFRLTDSRHNHAVLSAETESEAMDWAESLIEHGATGLMRSITVKPKASMSFKSFRRPKAAAGPSEAHEQPNAAMRSFKPGDRNRATGQETAQPQSLALESLPQQQARPATATGRRTRKGVHFGDEEPPPKRLSAGM